MIVELDVRNCGHRQNYKKKTHFVNSIFAVDAFSITHFSMKS